WGSWPGPGRSPMARFFKPAGAHIALVAFIVTGIVIGIVWFRTTQEYRRVAEGHRALAAELAQANESLATSRSEVDRIHAEMEKRLVELDQRIASLAEIRPGPRAELQEPSGPFAFPQGEIRWIDHVGRRVWINLGEANGLKPRTTFNVYHKTRSRVNGWKVEVAISPDEVKGSIEVTRVLEANLSEARILRRRISIIPSPKATRSIPQRGT